MALVAAFAVPLSIASPASAALITPSADPNAIGQAMSAQPGLVTGAGWEAGTPSSASANGVRRGGAGRFFPTDGPSFGVMTTGDVANADPPNDSTSKGTSNGTSLRNANDVSILRVDVNVPQGANCLGLDLAFYSEEFPEFVGSRYNDAFLAQIDNNSWNYDQATNTVSAPGNFAFDTNGKQLTVNTALRSPLDTLLQYDGSTDLLTARTPVSPGRHSVYLSIFDAGDHIYDSAAFLDNLRAAALPPSLCTPGAHRSDTDGDGIPDDMERQGVNPSGSGPPAVNLPAMGADPNHKDLFIQLDSMNGDALDPAALAQVVASFARAPVSNPDGRTGIRVHIDAGPNSIMNPVTGARWRGLSRAHPNLRRQNVLGSFSGNNYNWGAFDVLKAANFSPNRAPAFRYAISGHQYGSGSNNSSGIARGIPASDFIVALGRNCGGAECAVGGTGGQGGTFMHELGHTLGLGHGGGDGINYKPNYPSIMNYSFQFGGLLRAGSSTPFYDYSRYGLTSPLGTVAPLGETALSEGAGVASTGGARGLRGARYCGTAANASTLRSFVFGSATDWNCNRRIDGGPQNAQVNGNSTLEALWPFDDWANLSFRGGGIGGLGLSADLPTVTEKQEDRSVTELQRIAAKERGDTRVPRITANRRIRRRRLVLTATDNRSLDRLIVVVNRKRRQFKPRGRSKRRLVARLGLRRGTNRIVAIAFDWVGNRRTVRLRVRVGR